MNSASIQILSLAVGLACACACAREPEASDCDLPPKLERSEPEPPRPAPAIAPAIQQPAIQQPAIQQAAVDGPRLRILGIAQDGGLPHVACDCERCDAARGDPDRASPVASVAVIAPAGRGVWIVDATPDLPEQLDMLADVRERELGRVDRTPLSGILLTHAHMGHYLGLAALGFEAVSAEAVPVHASARMVEFLATHAPWDQLVRLHNIEPRVAAPGVTIALADGLTAEPLPVPHRGEYTDTFAWYLHGPRRRALYIPDTDPWPTWERGLDEVLDGVDLLVLDGTFYSGAELPGRDVTEIGHPLMTDSMDRLEPRLGGGLEIWFVHLNHSNPTLDPASPERRELEARGFAIAAVGREYGL